MSSLVRGLVDAFYLFWILIDFSTMTTLCILSCRPISLRLLVVIRYPFYSPLCTSIPFRRPRTTPALDSRLGPVLDVEILRQWKSRRFPDYLWISIWFQIKIRRRQRRRNGKSGSWATLKARQKWQLLDLFWKPENYLCKSKTYICLNLPLDYRGKQRGEGYSSMVQGLTRS